MAVYTEKVKDVKTGQMVTKKVNGKIQYYIRTYVTLENGQKKQITKHNKEWLGREGMFLAQQEENRLKNKIIIEPSEKELKKSEILFGELLKIYLNNLKCYSKDSTYYSHENVIKNQIIPYFNKELPISLIDIKAIKNWHNKLEEKKLSLSYKNKCHMIMSNILKVEIEFNENSKNVANVVGNFKKSAAEKEDAINKKEIRYLTFEQFKIFINSINDILWFTFFNTLYFTGIRKGEAQALRWEDIDFIQKKIFINNNLTVKTKDSIWKLTSTKNYQKRQIDIDDNLYQILLNYYNFKKRNNEALDKFFVFGNEQPLKQHRIDTNKDKYFKRVNVPKITNHEFRHSHVSLMINEYIKSGQTDTTKFFIMMSNRLGHTIEVMQKTYLHLFPTVQSEIISLINKLNTENI